ncbi:Deoxyribodipyrimidine photo-lyase [Posidoniimonas polymericola]|uniref:Deoxyribodipyrimidine photo-lyase n=1 Tax=Posidoniimonas polymericola TaxID=2528002 RepID=A0A5C5YKU3_9BACT|nr:FAD-binding domain-containing protein [Posidoniimonas polymericola]TWT75467.1 Deoxyribodipyrimidine photo-lyase [Posidoniimonas polymericola]
MRRDFENREQLIDYVRTEFPEAAAVSDFVSDIRGGLAAAEQQFDAVDPVAYGRTRNSLDGAVTGLSPYLRHGVLGLAETISRVKQQVDSPQSAYKLLQELAWRDYWRRVLDEIGDDVWEDQEPYKTGFDADYYQDSLPDDFVNAETGNDFVDGVVRELHETGYLHNQLRMKIAAYLVHWRRVRWQAGAAWMLSHLLDGDLASNNLSWQWVASTFAAKPYIFNQENLQHVTCGRFTGADADGASPFADSYDELNARLFPGATPQ